MSALPFAAPVLVRRSFRHLLDAADVFRQLKAKASNELERRHVEEKFQIFPERKSLFIKRFCAIVNNFVFSSRGRPIPEFGGGWQSSLSQTGKQFKPNREALN